MRFSRGRVAVFFAALGLVACSTPPGPLQLTLEPETPSSPAVVRVSGLGSKELSSLRAAQWTDRDWNELLQVGVAGSTTPIVGRYVVTDDALEFQPRFPLDHGRSYAVRLNPAELPAPRSSAEVTTTVSIPADAPSAATRVSAIYPSGRVWPANLLRFYLHFSGHMSRSSAMGHVRLLASDDTEVPEALLPSDVNFWNDDQTRYTIFFDPGRVKRGILPNRLMGRALIPGRRYAIDVGPEWTDASGRALAERFRHEITAGPAIERALDIKEWRIAPPRAGTTAPLVVTFPAPLDHALLQRALGVSEKSGATVAGHITIGPSEVEWRFTPSAPWRAARYDLIALSVLEDPSGNRINQPFEVDPADEAEPEPERYALPFDVK